MWYHPFCSSPRLLWNQFDFFPHSKSSLETHPSWVSWEHWGWWNPPKNYCSRLKCRVCSISCNISIFIRILYGNPNPPFIFADSHAWRIFPNCQAPSWASTPGATTSFVPWSNGAMLEWRCSGAATWDTRTYQDIPGLQGSFWRYTPGVLEIFPGYLSVLEMFYCHGGIFG